MKAQKRAVRRPSNPGNSNAKVADDVNRLMQQVPARQQGAEQ